jgi:class 3 adenylate cyclase
MHYILIIEDDPAVSIGLEELLTSEKYKVSVSADGKEGLEKALKIFPDIVILDINLPSLNGFDVCRKLRENKFSNPVIMLTSNSDQVDKIVGLEIGADDYITKPFNNRELLARIRVQLRKNKSVEKAADNSSKGMKRKLLTIMFTDIVDYSKIMNKDEQQGINILEVHNKLMRECIEKGNGKIIEIIGDAFLVSFDSAVEAMNCAVNIQKRFVEYNKDEEKQNKINIRIGLHLGDVVMFEGKLKGDVINIAARIQEKAEAGSVYFSESVNSAVKNRIEWKSFSRGKYSLKNISEPLELFTIKLEEQ